MKRIIFGLTDLADVLFYELKEANISVDAFCVHKDYLTKTIHIGKAVVAYEEVKKIFEGEELGIYLCVGYHNMNQIREKLYYQLKEQNIQILSFVHNTAVVMAEQIGEGCLIFEHTVLGPYTKIGNGNIFYPKSMVSHHSIVGDFNFFAISSSVAGNVNVGNNCFIGNNATTKDGIWIRDFTLVGAASYVSRDTKTKGCVVPAKSIELINHVSTDFL